MNSIEEQVRCLALVVGIRIEPDHEAQVIESFQRLLALSASLAEFPIPPIGEILPIGDS